MSTRTLIVMGGILLVFLGGAFLLRDQIFPTAEARRARLLRRLNEQEIVVRRSCGLGEAYVDGGRWSRLNAGDQERAAAAIASWCAEQGGEKTLDVLDSNTRTSLGRWNGAAFEAVASR
jgi:hypothetical protein